MIPIGGATPDTMAVLRLWRLYTYPLSLSKETLGHSVFLVSILEVFNYAKYKTKEIHNMKSVYRWLDAQILGKGFLGSSQKP